MAKTNGSANAAFSPFMDMSKFMPTMDMTKFMPDMSSMSMKMPGFDVQSMMEAQRRAAETMTEMGQRTFAGFQAVMQRQGEMVRESMQESAGLMSQVMAAGTPEEKVARQTDLAKTAFEKCMANGRELMEMVAQNNREATEMMTNRMNEAMEEFRTACASRRA